MAGKFAWFGVKGGSLAFLLIAFHGLATDFLVESLNIFKSLFNRAFKLDDNSGNGGGLGDLDAVLGAAKV